MQCATTSVSSLSGVKRSCILKELMDEGAGFRTSSPHCSYILRYPSTTPSGSLRMLMVLNFVISLSRTSCAERRYILDKMQGEASAVEGSSQTP
jgi:hypothetical protein